MGKLEGNAGSVGPLRAFQGDRGGVLYLASDDSRFTTAIDLVVDGGMAQL